MDQLPNYTSHSNEYDAIDHGTSELDPKHAILVEKVTWHHSLIFHLNPLTSLRYSWTGHPWLCSPHCITNLHPNEAHPNPTARGGRNHTLPTGHIYPPLKPKSKYEQPSSSPGVTAGICHMAILKILVGMLPSLMWLVRKEMIYNSTSALTASYQHTVVEVLVNWPIRIPTKKYEPSKFTKKLPPPHLTFIPSQFILILQNTPTTMKPPSLLNTGPDWFCMQKTIGNPMLCYLKYFTMKLSMYFVLCVYWQLTSLFL